MLLGYTLKTNDQKAARYGSQAPAYFWATCKKGTLSQLTVLQPPHFCYNKQFSPLSILKKGQWQFLVDWQNAMTGTTFRFSVNHAKLQLAVNKRAMIHADQLSRKRLIIAIKLLVVAALCFVALSGCGTVPPDNPNDICAIFKQYPRWYWESLDSYKHWGVPISVQMAIIKQESHFREDARPPRTKLLGFIPWSRPTTAYGYAQAVNGTWEHYQQETGSRDTDRDEFGDAVDFVGWYADKATKNLVFPSAMLSFIWLTTKVSPATPRAATVKKPG